MIKIAMYTREIQAVSSRYWRERLMLKLIFNSDLSRVEKVMLYMCTVEGNRMSLLLIS